jgi:hypothetical protein
VALPGCLAATTESQSRGRYYRARLGDAFDVVRKTAFDESSSFPGTDNGIDRIANDGRAAMWFDAHQMDR